MHILKNVFRTRSTGTPQPQPQPNRAHISNAAGGYVYALDPMQRVDRFLILGSEGGT